MVGYGIVEGLVGFGMVWNGREGGWFGGILDIPVHVVGAPWGDHTAGGCSTPEMVKYKPDLQ